jgi:signal transduction histidine kinase
MARPSEQAARILIVDDEVTQMRALCDTLRDQGYQTTGCSAGCDALAALREAKFDLLLTDLMMPGMDGIALLRAAHALQPDLAGVVMTGKGTIATAVEAMKEGALDYVLKPFKLSAILPVLGRALEMRRLRLENALLEERLRERAAELEAANRDLEAFAYSVSHDLRSPLRAIDAYAQMLEEDLGDRLDELSRRHFGIMRDNSRRMRVLIDDILDFSRLGRQAVTRARVDMASVVDEAWGEVRGAAPATVDFTMESLPAALGDRALLKQVWMNLLANAVKYSGRRPHPEIRVSGTARDGEVEFCVRDNGVGFDMQYHDKLFEAFQRLHPAAEYPGSGVGLAIVQRIIVRHGGRLWAEGRENAGAAFFFSLPRSRTDE